MLAKMITFVSPEHMVTEHPGQEHTIHDSASGVAHCSTRVLFMSG